MTGSSASILSWKLIDVFCIIKEDLEGLAHVDSEVPQQGLIQGVARVRYDEYVDFLRQKDILA